MNILHPVPIGLLNTCDNFALGLQAGQIALKQANVPGSSLQYPLQN